MPYAQILSVAFEFAEYSLQHQLANFEEVLPSPLLRFATITYIYTVLVGPREFNTHTTSPMFVELPLQWILDVLICNWLGAYLGGCWVNPLGVID